MEGWRPRPRLPVVLRPISCHHNHLNLNVVDIHHGARDNHHQLDDKHHVNRARHNHNRTSSNNLDHHHKHHDPAHGAHRRTHDDLPADNKHQPAEHHATNRKHQPNIDFLIHCSPPGRNRADSNRHHRRACGYPRRASSQSDRRTAGPRSHPTSSPNRADNHHCNPSGCRSTNTETQVKDELKALPMTLLGSWYVIITLGGSTKTAAITGTAIGLALHFTLTALLKDNDK